MRKIFAYTLITLLFCTTGCVKENMDDCFTGFSLKFNFSLHNDEPIGNRFGDRAKSVWVYLFDENNRLTMSKKSDGVVLSNDYVMDIDVPEGKYTVIALAASSDDFFRSFSSGHVTSPDSDEATTLENFCVMLNMTPDGETGNFVPKIDEFDDLFYGAVGKRTPGSSKYVMEQVEITNGTIVEREVELIRNSNVIKLKVTGLSFLQNRAEGEDVKLDVWVSGCNGITMYDNTILEGWSVKYSPYKMESDGNTMLTDIKTVRLDMDYHTANPMYLTIYDPVSKVMYPSKPIDIISTLLKAKNPETGEYIYNSQEDFDREYEHPIEIRIAEDLSVSVFIRGWQIITIKPEI